MVVVRSSWSPPEGGGRTTWGDGTASYRLPRRRQDRARGADQTVCIQRRRRVRRRGCERPRAEPGRSPPSTTSPRCTSPTRRCWPTTRSTPCTTRCPTACTACGRCGRWHAASTCCARSPSPPTPMRHERVADAADASGLVVMEAFHWRYHPMAARMLEIIASGELGDVRRVEAALCFPLPMVQGHQMAVAAGRRGADGRRLLSGPHGADAGRRRADGGPGLGASCAPRGWTAGWKRSSPSPTGERAAS